jgi:hypothetical protein
MNRTVAQNLYRLRPSTTVTTIGPVGYSIVYVSKRNEANMNIPDDYGWPELCHHANVVRQFKDLRLETLAGISDQRFELARVFIVFLL